MFYISATSELIRPIPQSGCEITLVPSRRVPSRPDKQKKRDKKYSCCCVSFKWSAETCMHQFSPSMPAKTHDCLSVWSLSRNLNKAAHIIEKKSQNPCSITTGGGGLNVFTEWLYYFQVGETINVCHSTEIVAPYSPLLCRSSLTLHPFHPLTYCAFNPHTPNKIESMDMCMFMLYSCIHCTPLRGIHRLSFM